MYLNKPAAKKKKEIRVRFPPNATESGMGEKRTWRVLPAGLADLQAHPEVEEGVGHHREHHVPVLLAQLDRHRHLLRLPWIRFLSFFFLSRFFPFLCSLGMMLVGEDGNGEVYLIGGRKRLELPEQSVPAVRPRKALTDSLGPIPATTPTLWPKCCFSFSFYSYFINKKPLDFMRL